KTAPPQNPPATETKPAAANASTDEYARHLEEAQRQQQQNLTPTAGAGGNPGINPENSLGGNRSESGAGTQPAPTPDLVADDLKKRTYTSLYSSNVALSYRQPETRPTGNAVPQPTLDQLMAAIPGLPIAPDGAAAASSLNVQAQARQTPKAVPANPNLAT